MWKWIMILCALISTNFCTAELHVLAFPGSTREGSVNKKLVEEAADFARQMNAQVTVINLKDFPIPFYDADLEAKEGMPDKAKQLRQLMSQSQAIFIASPEYNGSLSAVLKNAIDWASRSEDGKPSKDAFKGKFFLIMSASPGSGGGARGLVHLRAILENVGGIVIAKQFVLPNAYSAFDDQGHLKVEKLKNELKQLVESSLSSSPV